MADQLLPSNATPFERDMEQSMALYDDLRDIPIDRLWSAGECPAPLLPWLAWGLGVGRWDPGWPEELRRAVVANAIRQHKERGTLAAVRRALTDVGAVFDIEENPGGARHTMAVSIYNSNALLGARDLATVRSYIDDAKRFSTHYTLTLAASLDPLELHFGVAVESVVVAQVALDLNDGAG